MLGSGITPLCGYCGRPVGWGDAQRISGGVVYHFECTRPPQPAGRMSADVLQALITSAKARYDAMTPEERETHDKAVRESFVHYIMPTGDPRLD